MIEGIQQLGITDLTDLEQQCLKNVLSKPELEGAVKIAELEEIMRNFPEYND